MPERSAICTPVEKIGSRNEPASPARNQRSPQ